MDSGYYAALTGLVARSQALDTAAANLANAQTPGFRAEREYFRSVLLGPDAFDSQLGRTVNNYGLLGGDRLNMAQGAIQQTGNPLDLAIEGEGFFQVQTPNGLRYTRDGGFHRAPNGRLVTAAGEPVLSATSNMIAVPPGEVAVGAGGVLSVAGGVVDTVGVFTFSPGAQMIPEGANRYIARDGSSPALAIAEGAVATVGVLLSAPSAQMTPEGANRYIAPAGATPVLAKNAAIHQGAIEAANQDVIQGSLDLIVMQRQAEMMQKALTIFHTEFNKIASEDLPRV
jgi:flagellar basal-body rod protein FlgF/flagellar basal-body rod protein FlgG